MTWWLVKTAGTGREGEGATTAAAKALQTGQRLPGQIKPHTGTTCNTHADVDRVRQ